MQVLFYFSLAKKEINSTGVQVNLPVSNSIHQTTPTLLNAPAVSLVRTIGCVAGGRHSDGIVARVRRHNGRHVAVVIHRDGGEPGALLVPIVIAEGATREGRHAKPVATGGWRCDPVVGDTLAVLGRRVDEGLAKAALGAHESLGGRRSAVEGTGGGVLVVFVVDRSLLGLHFCGLYPALQLLVVGVEIKERQGLEQGLVVGERVGESVVPVVGERGEALGRELEGELREAA